MAEPSSLTRFPSTFRDGAEAAIREIAANDTGRVFFLDHVQDRMVQRGFTTRQIFKVLRHGELVSGPEWDTKMERGWKCVFKRLTGGECIEVVAKLVERDGLCVLLVTMYGR